MTIHQIFPEPVYFSKLERALTKEELRMIHKFKKKKNPNEGNTNSAEKYILKNKALKNLKKDLHKIIIDYFDKVVCTNDAVIPYITQSWINSTTINQFHHHHAHSNSYISGVFYIDAKKEVDKITFYKSGHKELLLYIARVNTFNAVSWWFPVETGDVVLFPSTLIHGVDKKKGTNTRVSLSFNVFLKGHMGNINESTELVLT